MKRTKRWSLIVIIYLIGFFFIGSTIYSQEENGLAPALPQDGVVECHNFVKDGKKPNCVCWGQQNPDNPQNTQCKPPGEDPKCTNHCKRQMCKCKLKCQS